MKKLKNYLYIFLLLSLVSQTLPADDIEKQDLTKLAQYLKQRDNHQQKLQSDIRELWGACYHRIETSRPIYNGTEVTTRYIPRLGCQSILFKELYKNRQEIKSFRDDTKKQISQMMCDGVSINRSDDHGKTALNYIQSRDQYNALRQLGANFQADAFMKVNQFQLIAVTMLAAVWGYLIINDINVTVEKKKSSLMDASINSRDEKGRTPLMNYIIQRQEQFYRDRIYTCNISMVLFVLKTNEEMSRMVKSGADVSMKDYDGCTVMDYCTITEFHDHLRSLGGSFDLKRWALVKSVHLTAGVVISAFVLAMIKITTSEGSLDQNSNIGYQFDQMFERN